MFKLIGLFAAAVTISAAPGASLAQDAYPSDPIVVVVPFPPGGNVDSAARVVLDAAGKIIGAPFVVENQPGAFGTIGAKAVSSASPDGYKLLMTAHNVLTMNMNLQPDYPVDPVEDFAPVALVTDTPMALVVNASVPANTTQELIDYALEHPDALSYFSSGIGGGQHIAGELFRAKAGIVAEHIPYSGGGPAVQDLAAGVVQFGFATLASVVPQAEAGRVRILAVVADERLESMPDIPTLDETEAVRGIQLFVWTGILAPKGTPQPIIEKLNGSIVEALKQPETVAKLAAQGQTPVGGSAGEMAALIPEEIVMWKEIFADLGLTSH